MLQRMEKYADDAQCCVLPLQPYVHSDVGRSSQNLILVPLWARSGSRASGSHRIQVLFLQFFCFSCAIKHSWLILWDSSGHATSILYFFYSYVFKILRIKEALNLTKFMRFPCLAAEEKHFGAQTVWAFESASPDLPVDVADVSPLVCVG